RRPGLGHRLHLRLPHAGYAQAGRGMARGIRLARDPFLGFPDAAQAVRRVDLPEVPPGGHRRPAGHEAPGGLSADREVWLHRLPKATPPADFCEPPAKTDPAKGKELFLQKGCMACHQHRPYVASPVVPTDPQQADRKEANPDYKPDPATTYDPKMFPESVRP